MNDFPKFTIIMRNYSIKQALKIAEIAREYNEYFAIEVTLNTGDAFEIIRKMKEKFSGQICIGAGTVLTMDEAIMSIENGAEFLLSPMNFSEDIIKYCKNNSVLAVPGAFSPSEIYRQLSYGADIVKVFPSAALPARFYSDLQGPFGELPLMAVGGVGIDDIKSLDNCGVSYFGIGSSMFPTEALVNLDEKIIRKSLETYIEVIQSN